MGNLGKLGTKIVLASALVPISLMLLSWGLARSKSEPSANNTDRPPQEGTHEAPTRPEKPPAAGSVPPPAAGRVLECVRVRFLNGSKEEQKLVKSVVWEHVNTLPIPVRFAFIPNGNHRARSVIRIQFVSPGTSWSQLGLGPDSWDTAPTMALNLHCYRDAARKRRSILHEFGHALGLHHQHQHPDCRLQWNAKELKLRYGCDDSQVRDYYFAKRPCPVSMPYDPDSVMHYAVEVGDAHGLAEPIRPGARFSPGDEQRLILMYANWPGISLPTRGQGRPWEL
ncbi:hypothetical protein PG985_012963 [Apiospora marii]|uniref:Metalloendopeptidase n=1 Tax=Apiospora marii TaxID=335849 RepID=A0ABR1RC34_9PEZI